MVKPPPLPGQRIDPDLARELAKAAKLGIVISPPMHPVENAACEVEFFLEQVEAAKKVALPLTFPNSLPFEQMLKETETLDYLIDDFQDAGGMLREDLKELKADGYISRIPTPAERKLFFPLYYQAEVTGNGVGYEDILWHAHKHGVDYIVRLPSKHKTGCLSVIIFALAVPTVWIMWAS